MVLPDSRGDERLRNNLLLYITVEGGVRGQPFASEGRVTPLLAGTQPCSLKTLRIEAGTTSVEDEMGAFASEGIGVPMRASLVVLTPFVLPWPSYEMDRRS